MNYLNEIHHNVIIVFTGFGSLIDALVFSCFDSKSLIIHNFTHITQDSMEEIILLSFLTLLALTMAIISYQLLPPPVGKTSRVIDKIEPE